MIKSADDILKAATITHSKKLCGCHIDYVCNHKLSCGCYVDDHCFCLSEEVINATTENEVIARPGDPTLSNRADACEGEEWAVVIMSGGKVAVTRVKTGDLTKVGNLQILHRCGHDKEEANRLRLDYLVVEDVITR